MMVELNGRSVELPEGATVRDLIARSGVDGEAKGVAVALDGDVIPRGSWAATELREGQSVEVVAAIQGG
jgi:sulfur carrier protein